MASFAQANGLTVGYREPGRKLIGMDGTAGAVEAAFHVAMLTYQHPTEARTCFAPDSEPWVDLDTPILRISGLDNLCLPPPPVTMCDGTDQGQYIGMDFRNAYLPGVQLTGAGQVLAIISAYGPHNIESIQAYEDLAVTYFPGQYPLDANGHWRVPTLRAFMFGSYDSAQAPSSPTST